MSFLTLDIETIPQARWLEPVGFQASDAWLDEHPGDGIEQAIREGTVPLAATGVAPSLHPSTCHIVQVSFGWRANGAGHSKVCQIDDYQTDSPNTAEWEASLIREALDILHGAVIGKRSRIVTFNGKGFDLPVLRTRAALLRLQTPVGPPIPWRRLLYPYSDDQHADLRLVLGADDRRARGTLQWWAEAFGVHAEEHGAEVWDWVRALEWEKLRAYGVTEARTLVELFEAVEPAL